MFIDHACFFDQGLNFECQRCGQCCTGESGTIYVSPKEIAAVAGHLGITADLLIETYLYPFRDSYSIREDDQGCCLFYNQGCNIYPVRPLQCSTYPFWFSNLRSERRWRALRRECPGIGQGRLYTREEILGRVQHAMKF
ncbi:MAG: YkgJ family cysteine cluster protein [Desulfatitalea sp.]|nr:YkgJ family cysteine cluster protein [Desulfatitalea sp.]MBI5895522.1 YkgJ family cysteine cluster protein [Desulfobacterales bacterium]